MCKLLIFTSATCACTAADCPHHTLPAGSAAAAEHRGPHARIARWEHCVAWRSMEFEARHVDRDSVAQVCWDAGAGAVAEFGERAPRCPDGRPGKEERSSGWMCGTCDLHRRYFEGHMHGRC